MQKMVPLIGILVASFFTFRAAKNLPDPLSSQPASPPKTPVAKSQGRQPLNEPVHKAVIRCLSDIDDLLDTIHDPASFAAVKPKLLSRAQQQKDLASAHPNQGMTQLGRAEKQEMQKAINRHTQSLTRAIQVVPEVREFFEKDIAAILTQG
jgi:hypothetical protein